MPEYRSASGSAAEDLFIDLLSNTFGAKSWVRKKLSEEEADREDL